ncbi:hypothetical protein EV361DRAFT_943289, partial [Lentinula raphanica]
STPTKLASFSYLREHCPSTLFTCFLDKILDDVFHLLHGSMTALQPRVCTYLLFVRRFWCKLIKAAVVFIFRAIRVPLNLDIVEIIKYGDTTWYGASHLEERRLGVLCPSSRSFPFLPIFRMELSSKIVELGFASVYGRASAMRVGMTRGRVCPASSRYNRRSGMRLPSWRRGTCTTTRVVALPMETATNRAVTTMVIEKYSHSRLALSLGLSKTRRR